MLRTLKSLKKSSFHNVVSWRSDNTTHGNAQECFNWLAGFLLKAGARTRVLIAVYEVRRRKTNNIVFTSRDVSVVYD